MKAIIDRGFLCSVLFSPSLEGHFLSEIWARLDAGDREFEGEIADFGAQGGELVLELC